MRKRTSNFYVFPHALRILGNRICITFFHFIKFDRCRLRKMYDPISYIKSLFAWFSCSDS